MADADRRRHSRHLLRIEGHLAVSEPHHPLVLVDISAEGIGLEAQQSLAPATRIAVEIGDAQSERIRFRGKVVWCVQDQTGGLPIYRMGICTDTIGFGDQTAVLPDEMLVMLGRIVAFFGSRQPGASIA